MPDISPCTREEQDQILAGLMEYNVTRFEGKSIETMVEDLSKKVVDEHGDLIGGIIARRYLWQCAYVDVLWVRQDQRGNGLGARLLREVEQEAASKQAKLIHLDTFDFQAKEFYEKQGYQVFGALENCMGGHTRYYMKKNL